MADTVNPFDVLHSLLDPDATFENNVARIQALLEFGKLDLQLVAHLLVEADVMPVLAANNYRLNMDLKNLSKQLEMANACIRDYSEQFKKMSVASQDGITAADERQEACRMLKFPNGELVN